MSSTALFSVEMTCSGCSNACTRILKNIPGVNNVEASLEEKKIKVDYDSSKTKPEVLLEALQKWGTASKKNVALISA